MASNDKKMYGAPVKPRFDYKAIDAAFEATYKACKQMPKRTRHFDHAAIDKSFEAAYEACQRLQPKPLPGVQETLPLKRTGEKVQILPKYVDPPTLSIPEGDVNDWLFSQELITILDEPFKPKKTVQDILRAIEEDTTHHSMPMLVQDKLNKSAKRTREKYHKLYAAPPTLSIPEGKGDYLGFSQDQITILDDPFKPLKTIKDIICSIEEKTSHHETAKSKQEKFNKSVERTKEMYQKHQRSQKRAMFLDALPEPHSKRRFNRT